jgi:hypothetical protein
MKVLMVMQHVNFFRNLDTVVRDLGEHGWEVTLLHGTRQDDERTRERLQKKRASMGFLGRGIMLAETELGAVTVGYRPEPSERTQLRLRAGRRLFNRTIYLRKNHPAPVRVAESLDRQLPMVWQDALQVAPVRWLLGHPLALRVWRAIESRAKPSNEIVELLREIAPDVVLVSPTVWPKHPVEADYIRAARELGIPTIGYLNSWDNLTSKGTVHVLPDRYLVWNEALAEEAESLHDIPRNRIVVTGAAHVDRFFSMKPTVTRAEQCAAMDCPDRPYVVYLCTSRSLLRDELELVTSLADAFERRFGSSAPTLVVRPHPTNADPWLEYEHAGVVVHPLHGDQADSADSWQAYCNQLGLASCVFGINTTAFLESVALDLPCLTIVSDELYPAQGLTGHFRHLLAGDFLEVAADADEVAARVGRIIDGEDEKAVTRRRFAESFLRPRGIDLPVTPVVVQEIVSAARPAAESAPVAEPAGQLVAAIDEQPE